MMKNTKTCFEHDTYSWIIPAHLMHVFLTVFHAHLQGKIPQNVRLKRITFALKFFYKLG